jgi:hypothetical protein
MPRGPLHLVFPLLLTACGGGGGDGGAPGTGAARLELPSAAGLDALQIAELLAADDERTPAGFYVDPAATSGHFRSTRHLTTRDVDPSAGDEHELCASDPASAHAWQEADAQRQATYPTLTGSSRTALYFEFVRDVGDPARQEAVRIFDCGFIDRQGVDRHAPAGFEGRLARLPPSGADVRLLGEYLWTFSRYNNTGHAVLDSTVVDTPDGLRHTLVQAERWPGAAAGGTCDTVQVFERRLDVDGIDGRLASSELVLWSFDVAFRHGAAEPCPD